MKVQTVLAVLITLCLVLAACGGQESTSGVSPEATSVSTAAPGSTTAGTLSATPADTPIPATATPAPPAASFSVDLESGDVPLTVNFNNASEGSITSFEWEFGDGTTSTDRAPTHVYTIAGTHEVTLTVSGPGGTDTTVKSGLITIQPGPPTSIEVSPTVASQLSSPPLRGTSLGTRCS